MPEHCQMAVLMDFNRGLDEIYGFGRREQNVKEMVDSPLPEMYSAADETMAYALSSSSKQQDDKPKRKRGSKKQKKQLEKQPDNVLATVQSYRVEPIDFKDASIGEAISQAIQLHNLLYDRVQYVGFNESQKLAIFDALFFMVMWKPCADAFKTAGLATPAEVIRDRSAIFINFGALEAPLSDDLKNLGFTDEQRSALYTHGNSIYLRGGGGYTPDPNTKDGIGKPVITVLFDTTINGTAHYSMGETMPHESIHRSGVAQENGWWNPYGVFTHDLAGYEHYDNIVKNCDKSEALK